MSHYSQAATPFKNRDDLVLVLEEMYGKGKVEVFESNKLGTMRGYGGQQRPAEIIIRRDTVGGYGDLGFMRSVKTGKYEAIYDTRVDFQRISQRYLEIGIGRRMIGSGRYRIISSSKDEVVVQSM